MELLEYSEELGRVIPSPEAREITAFKHIIAKDKGSPGDADGRKKFRAIKMLTYIRLIEHPISPFMDNEPRDRHDKICDFIDADFDQLDPLLVEGRRVYADIVSSATVQTLTTIKNGLFSAIQLMEKLREQAETLLDKEDIQMVEIEAANKMIDNMLDKANKVPSTIQVLEGLEEKVKKQQSTRSKIKGSGSVNHFEQ